MEGSSDVSGPKSNTFTVVLAQTPNNRGLGFFPLVPSTYHPRVGTNDFEIYMKKLLVILSRLTPSNWA